MFLMQGQLVSSYFLRLSLFLVSWSPSLSGWLVMAAGFVYVLFSLTLSCLPGWSSLWALALGPCTCADCHHLLMISAITPGCSLTISFSGTEQLDVGMLNFLCFFSHLLEIALCLLTCWTNLCSLYIDFTGSCDRPSLVISVYGSMSGDLDETVAEEEWVCAEEKWWWWCWRGKCVCGFPFLFPLDPCPTHC